MATTIPNDLADIVRNASESELREIIVSLSGEYADRFHAPRAFVPGESMVPVSGKVVGAPELRNLVDASLDLWLTTGSRQCRLNQHLRSEK